MPKISAYPDAATLTGAELLPAVQSGSTVKATPTQIATFARALGSTDFISWNADVFLRRDASNALALRNGTAAQTFNVYNTFTDASNYERMVVGVQSGVFQIRTEFAGTGSPKELILNPAAGGRLRFATDGTTRWNVTSGGGHFFAEADNAYDIGAAGANRPRTIYAGTQVNAPYYQFASLGSQIRESANGVLAVYNGAFNDFGRLQFGGTTNAFPSIKRSGTKLQARLADDSANADLDCRIIQPDTFTVAGLPAAAGRLNARTMVTDSSVVAAGNFGNVVAGGGANIVPVYSDGTSWRIG